VEGAGAGAEGATAEGAWAVGGAWTTGATANETPEESFKNVAPVRASAAAAARCTSGERSGREAGMAAARGLDWNKKSVHGPIIVAGTPGSHLGHGRRGIGERPVIRKQRVAVARGRGPRSQTAPKSFRNLRHRLAYWLEKRGLRALRRFSATVWRTDLATALTGGWRRGGNVSNCHRRGLASGAFLRWCVVVGVRYLDDSFHRRGLASGALGRVHRR
jgi:hypothetical protein